MVILGQTEMDINSLVTTDLALEMTTEGEYLAMQKEMTRSQATSFFKSGRVISLRTKVFDTIHE